MREYMMPHTTTVRQPIKQQWALIGLLPIACYVTKDSLISHKVNRQFRNHTSLFCIFSVYIDKVLLCWCFWGRLRSHMQISLKMSQQMSTGKSSSVLTHGKEGEQRRFDSINRCNVGIYFCILVKTGKEVLSYTSSWTFFFPTFFERDTCDWKFCKNWNTGQSLVRNYWVQGFRRGKRKGFRRGGGGGGGWKKVLSSCAIEGHCNVKTVRFIDVAVGCS